MKRRILFNAAPLEGGNGPAENVPAENPAPAPAPAPETPQDDPAPPPSAETVIDSEISEEDFRRTQQELERTQSQLRETAHRAGQLEEENAQLRKLQSAPPREPKKKSFWDEINSTD